MAARVELLSFSDGVIQTSLGQAVVALPVTIVQHGTSNQVPVYTNETGAPTLAQPLLTDNKGRIPGWVDERQRLDVVYTLAGVTVTTPLEAFSGVQAFATAANPGDSLPLATTSTQAAATNFARGALTYTNIDPVAVVFGRLGTTALPTQGFQINPNGGRWSTPADTGGVTYQLPIFLLSSVATSVVTRTEI